MKEKRKKGIIIMAEDDEDDRVMIRDASLEAGIVETIRFVANGEELMDLLRNSNKYSQNKEPFLPILIFLDLNMPKLDGRKALEKIKNNENFRKIPVIILTTSNIKEEIAWAYNSGANSFIIKPFSFDSMVDIMKSIKKYWLEMVALP